MLNALVKKIRSGQESRHEQLIQLTIKARFIKRYKELVIVSAVLFVAKILVILLFEHSARTFWQIISDALFIPGFGLVAYGFVTLGGYFGALDSFLYSTQRVFSLMAHWSGELTERGKRAQSFSDFVLERKRTRVSPVPYFVVGISTLAVSFLIAFLISS